MTTSEMLPATVLERKAVVYVRQSCRTQVETNLESRRRQYELVEVARRQGVRAIEVIDDDLGRSASGMVARPGFDRLVAALCAGEIGAVLCFDASRLARNGRDWHHLLELCGLVEARVIDLDGVNDPCRPNDRLLLGMKGSISEFELGILRARMLDAARAKAERGELRISVPVGYLWRRDHGLGFDPDLRLQQTIRLIFERFRQLSSARSKIPACRQNGRKSPNFDTMVSHRGAIGSSPMANGDQPLGRQPARHDMLGGVRLRHGLRAPAAGVSGAPRHQRLELCRDHVEPLGEVLADPCRLAAAAGAERAAGSITRSIRGRCAGRCPRLRAGLRGVSPRARCSAASAFSCAASSMPWASSASSKAKLNWSGDSFPERLPNRSRCEEREACLPAGGWPPAPRPGGCSRG